MQKAQKHARLNAFIMSVLSIPSFICCHMLSVSLDIIDFLIESNI